MISSYARNRYPQAPPSGKLRTRSVADVTPELKAKATEMAHDLGIGVSAYVEWLLSRDLAQLDAIGSTELDRRLLRRVPRTPPTAGDRQGVGHPRGGVGPAKTTKPAPICLAARAGIVPNTIGGPTIPGPRRGSGRGRPRVTRNGQSTTPTHACQRTGAGTFRLEGSEWLTADDPHPTWLSRPLSSRASDRYCRGNAKLDAGPALDPENVDAQMRTLLLDDRCDGSGHMRERGHRSAHGGGYPPREKAPQRSPTAFCTDRRGTHATAARPSDFTATPAVGTRPRRRSARDCARIGLGSCAEPRDRLPARRNQVLDTSGPVPTWTRPSISRIHRAQ